ncbi:hypothetical protein [Tautonia rosea]|uniref:hypothetical protein n=1 Tax=Tautonia rosea TaxID=2728037 RepID=UPI0014748C4C|nr:hypothetical protein [Tautonia rosea]
MRMFILALLMMGCVGCNTGAGPAMGELPADAQESGSETAGSTPKGLVAEGPAGAADGMMTVEP